MDAKLKTVSEQEAINVLFSGCMSCSFLYPVNVDFFFPALMEPVLCEVLTYSQEVNSATKWYISRNEKAINNYLFHFHCKSKRFFLKWKLNRVSELPCCNQHG